MCVRGVLCVWRGLARGKPPCVGSKRLRVYGQNARMCSTCARFARTHGGLLNLHTGTFEPAHGGPLSLSSPSLFLSSFLLSLFSLVFPLSNDDNDHSSSRLSLCKHGSDLPECHSAWAVAHSLLDEHVRIMQETTVWYNCAGNECVCLVVCWWCLVVRVCVSM